MKYVVHLILVFFFVICDFNVSYGASLLKAQDFPKTFADLTFSQRIAVLSEGYEILESVYDKEGRCISGCAYKGINIEEDIKKSEQNTADARNQMYSLGYKIGNNNKFMKTSDNYAQASPGCISRKYDIPAGQTEPVGEPLMGTPQITSSYGFRKHPITGEQNGHKGIDFYTPIGTSVFSTASGTVAAVWNDDTCGNGIKILHSNGYETIYCHLSKQLVAVGDKVSAGCEIAKTGNTGMSSGPHLHYSIKYNGNYTDPKNWIGRG